MVRILIYVMLTLISCAILLYGNRAKNIAKNAGTDESKYFSRLKDNYIKQYVDGYGSILMKLLPFTLLFVYLLSAIIAIFIIFKIKKYYLFFGLLGFIELYNAWCFFMVHNFFKNYLIMDNTNILKISILDKKVYKQVIYIYLNVGFILIILTMLFGIV